MISRVHNLAILQARMSSTRLPGKVMKEINGKTMIEIQISRILKAKSIDRLIVAITEDSSDDPLAEHLNDLGMEVFRGSPKNVYSRFAKILHTIKPKYFVRLTADCPLVMPKLIDEMVSIFNEEKPDYLSNSIVSTFPDGLDIEVVSTEPFLRLEHMSITTLEEEHVTLGLLNRKSDFNSHNFQSKIDLGKERWTVDYQEDLDFIRSIFQNFKAREAEIDMVEVLSFLSLTPSLKNLKSDEFRNISLKQQLERFQNEIQ